MIRNFVVKYKSVIVIFFTVKIILLALIFLSYPLFPFSSYDYLTNGYRFTQIPTTLEKSMAPYDGQWYLHIATNGYKNFHTKKILAQSYAFFPLYPLFIRIGSFFTFGNIIFSALFITFVSSFASVILLYKIIRLDYSELIARYSTIYFLITPSAIFFTAVYTEALFFALAAAAWYLTRIKRWWGSAFFSYLAALARPQGVFLFFPLAFEYVWNARKSSESLKKKIVRGVSLFGAPLGLFTYYTFLYFETGNFFTHLIVNKEQWSRTGTDFLEIIGLVYVRISHFASLPFYGFNYSQLDTVILVSSLILIVPMIIRLRPSYAIWAYILIALPLSTGITISIARYISLSFPHYLLFALAAARFRALHYFFIIVSSALAGVSAVRFVHWYWAG